jgi:hypothetical protein
MAAPLPHQLQAALLAIVPTSVKDVESIETLLPLSLFLCAHPAVSGGIDDPSAASAAAAAAAGVEGGAAAALAAASSLSAGNGSKEGAAEGLWRRVYLRLCRAADAALDNNTGGSKIEALVEDKPSAGSRTSSSAWLESASGQPPYDGEHSVTLSAAKIDLLLQVLSQERRLQLIQ